MNKTLNAELGTDSQQRVVRRLAIRWTCSDYANHNHRWKWTAWLCGRLQMVWPVGWYECSLCGHKVRLHRADMKIGCIKDGCHNIGLELRRCKSPNS